ncbi:glycosyltransferase [Elizabethkingia sp. JS20170427COW]|uniref:glycosyltransferase family 2 protein n=1 Tax=Elizabethkingia sp. JS20170427COW TaxID=2583851 RepID=UPI00111028CC|nr:glycosyltransferase [Elizabethkingia sp. JS20170427COW]QCX53300.1 glycosyltransferase [Elizabethkingia sp. JS20170427COW]
MKVSIIVPVYNVKAYLAKCLDSLIAQTLEDIEIIVVDDGSTDSSGKILKQYENKYPELIRAFNKENGGLSDARNFGINKAKGDFIGFVDSDDYVTADMFQEMYDLAMKHSAEMVICNLQKVDEKDNITQQLPQLTHLPEKIILKENFSIFSDLSYFACNKLFKKELFAKLRFKKGIHYEDIQLVPQLLLKCTIVAHTYKFHYQYLERASSISKTHTEKGLDILRAVEDVEVAFRNSAFKDYQKELQGFQILEGIYTFLAYLAFVKDSDVFDNMSKELKRFIQKRNIKTVEILRYNRFGRNYLLSLPMRKKIYYLLYFFHQEGIIKKILN